METKSRNYLPWTVWAASWSLLMCLACPGIRGGEATIPGPLDDVDLARRREALEKWAFEPLPIEGSAFLFHLDRRDGSFFLQDRRTGNRWFSSWARRGFASVMGASGWVPVDKIESLSSDDKSIRFLGASTRGGIPRIRFLIEALPRQSGLSLSFQMEGEAKEPPRVRILDECLWIPDGEKGGAAIPSGFGEWHSAQDDSPLRREVRSPLAPAEPFLFSFVGLVKSENPLLLAWTECQPAITMERKPVEGDSFPGRRGLFTTVEFQAASGAVRLYTLGKEESPVVDFARAYRETLAGTDLLRSLRSKSGTRVELRSFPAAALFRPSASSSSFESMARYAEHLRKDLELDAAAFLVRDWTVPGSAFKVKPEAGGTEGLKVASARIREMNFIFGLECEADAFEPPGGAGDASGRDRAVEEALESLKDLCSPQILLVGGSPAAGKSAWPPQSRSYLGAKAVEMLGLVGFRSGLEADLGHAALFEGILDGFATKPVTAGAWPIFTAAFGHGVRICVRPELAVQPAGAAAILAHLLVGEVPVYPCPPFAAGEGGGTEAQCFAQDDGWARGKDLSQHDVFLKNTFEVLSRVAWLRSRESLLYHQLLTPDGRVRESYFGPDLRIVVNFGPGNYEDKEDGFVIPPGGFVVRHPFVFAFHALRANDVEYERPAFFVVRSLEGKMYLRAEQVKIFHGFGPEKIQLGGKTFHVEREAVVKIW